MAERALHEYQPRPGGTMERIDAIVQKLVAADWKGRDAVKAELLAAAQQHADAVSLIDHLESAKREIHSLEVRWEIDEVIEAITPPPPEPDPEDEPEPEPEPDPNRPLSAADLDLVYDDPRGLMLHRSKVGDRWFATQVDPYDGNPRTQEVPPAQVAGMKAQLKGSPHWLLGSGMT
ncbi:MAG: hypothetical protein ACI8PZ_002199 [Myxococcota bacterium]